MTRWYKLGMDSVSQRKQNAYELNLRIYRAVESGAIMALIGRRLGVSTETIRQRYHKGWRIARSPRLMPPYDKWIWRDSVMERGRMISRLALYKGLDALK